MGCGTGKTLTSLMASIDMKTAVICPPALVHIWKNEDAPLKRKKPIVFLSSFNKEGIRKLRDFDCVIVDEAHKTIKTWNSSQELINFIKRTPFTFFLSATPLVHSPLDLYWILKLCSAHGLSRGDFTLHFCKGKRHRRNPRIIYPTGISNADSFKELLKGVSFSYFREEKIIKKVLRLGKDPIKSTDEIKTFSIEQSILAECKVSNVKVLNSLKKLVSVHKKIVVFHFHKTFLDLTEKFNPVYSISGETPINKREEIISKYLKEERGCPLFLNYKSSGEGLNIEGIKACVFLEKTWSDRTDYQAFMRLYRFNRKEPLIIYYFFYDSEQRKEVSSRKEQGLREIL